jgi:adenosine deaminase
MQFKNRSLIDLHCHLGGAVPSAVLWEILCDSGLHTEFDSFQSLHRFLSVAMGDIHSLDDFLGRYFHATELIQSSPQAANEAVYQSVAKAYRRCTVDAEIPGNPGAGSPSFLGMEIRYNPLKRIHGGRHTLGAIIMATIQGLQRVSMHYKVHTGILFSMGKELSYANNWTIVQAAIAFKGNGHLHGAHGVMGVDMAGPESTGVDTNPAWLKEVSKMIEEVRSAKLGVTWHVAETAHSGPDGLECILDHIAPDRIGHGIQLGKAKGAQRDRLCKILRERNICLEICPTVNLVTRSVKSLEEIGDLIRLLDAEKVPFCLNTDNPYLIRTNLLKEYESIEHVLGDDAYLLDQAHQHAINSTFMTALKEASRPPFPIL